MLCLHCQEPIESAAQSVPVNDGRDALHRECQMRTLLGSADCITRGDHPPGTCLPDDPALTKREAALAAAAVFKAKQQPREPGRDTTALMPTDLRSGELTAELALHRGRLETPGYFSQFGEDGENVRAALCYRVEALETELDLREWPRQL